MKLLSSWWKSNRLSAPGLFDGEVIRRMLLPRTQQHVYYVVEEEQGLVVIYTIWGARRGRGPKL